MRWRDLAAAAGIEPGPADPEVTGVSHHSAWVRPGDAFVAIRGAVTDGADHAAQAVANGATVVVGAGPDPGVGVPYVAHPHPRAALAALATELNGRPAEALRVVGVTGTDGKTTTSLLTRHLLRAGGVPTGLLSTVGYELPDGELRQPPAHFTTPEAPQVQQILREIVAAGGRAVVLETSSHALMQERVGGIRYDIGVWTHLSREHLDFHGSMDGYFAAKRRLIERSAHAVLNADDPWTAGLSGVAPVTTTYSPGGADADWRAVDVAETPQGLEFTALGPGASIRVRVPLVGRFNVENTLAAIAAAVTAGVGPEAIAAALPGFAGVPGRMEFVPGGAGDPRVVVDFAHTPDSIARALEALRPTTTGRLWIVLGVAGGPRDPGRRVPMGEAAGRGADVVVVTEDDSYDTPLEVLLGDLRTGAERAGNRDVRVVPDRVDAIRHAVHAAAPADTVLLAGKGPERELGRPSGPIEWSDVAQAAAALSSRV